MVNELKLGFDFVKEGLVTEQELDEMYQKTIERFETWNCATCCDARRTNSALS